MPLTVNTRSPWSRAIKKIIMKTRHHVAVQMEEEQQWQKDNGPIVKTVDQLWKYSGETEKNSADLLLEQMEETKKIILLDNGIYSLLSERRSKILSYWLENLDKPLKEIAKMTNCEPHTVTKAIAKYLKAFKELKNKNK
tara:strand:- start:1954 stop:2370 length:417 start_codon:yes stop_codon:yes gene_type:complete